LDEATADGVMEQFLALVAKTGAALLMVTHSPRLAARLGRRAHLSQGRLA
ncbi:MAG: ABC transporter ATP-binding protein, partial [Mesorhizobium sp.]